MNIIKKIKEQRPKREYKTITFVINKGIVDQFRTRCRKEKVSQVSVMKELMKFFVEDA